MPPPCNRILSFAHVFRRALLHGLGRAQASAAAAAITLSLCVPHRNEGKGALPFVKQLVFHDRAAQHDWRGIS